MVGKIIKAISGFYYIECENIVYECRAKGILKKKNVSPLVGDFAEFDIIGDGKGNLIKVVNRKNSLIRPPVANLDLIIIVMASKNPEPSLLFLDKQLAFLEYANIKPIICINKSDLSYADEIIGIYEKIGYTVIATSVKDNEGIDMLKKSISGKTVALVGNSGVGKSSITNCLLKNKVMVEGDLSKIERGKQTTRHSEMLKIDDNTYIIDTPGFSSFDLPDIELNKLAGLFVEFRDEFRNCKYNDCRHVLEEDCGIRKAVSDGKISQSRFENFKLLYEELSKRKIY